MGSRAACSSTTVYRPRRPEKTVVYQVVQGHLETWPARMREAEPDGDPVPRFVERDLHRIPAARCTDRHRSTRAQALNTTPKTHP
jgi:hypothetical protein